ncbi:MAG TPA: endonuclease/exonuclease/phosphatase family protein [Polyangia bacterium]|nr:endonuclease/exonuclease/phosphatase family protein [Polyangia bacterium]
MRLPPGSARFVTLNLWGENGPWEERMVLAAAELDRLAPDVVALQEVRDVPGRVGNQAARLAEGRGWHHRFAPTTAWGGGHEGLAVLSRFPIGAHEFRALPHGTETEGRGVLSVRLDGEARGVWVHTAHLSYRLNEGVKREEQVAVLDAVIAAHDDGQGTPQLLMGDFNAGPEHDEIRWLVGQHTIGGRRVAYQDAWAVAGDGGPGLTWARSNDYTASMHWLRQDRRLDYIFVTAARRDRRGTIHAARVALDRPATAASGERLFASDHYAVVADVQLVVPSTTSAVGAG